MNIAGTVKQHIQLAHFAGELRNVLRIEDIQSPGSNAGPILGEGRQRWLVDIGGPDHGSRVGKCDGGGAPNALSRRRNERSLSRKSSAHFRFSFRWKFVDVKPKR